jgi:nucleoside-diphosphate-sugar epimerase
VTANDLKSNIQVSRDRAAEKNYYAGGHYVCLGYGGGQKKSSTVGATIMRIFLAGASGAIGRRLTPLLIAVGHEVTGTTRSVDKVQELAAGGVDAVVVDVFNAGAVRDAVVRARPEIVIHQLTDLPQVLDPALLRDALSRNSRLRIEGTANLVAAAQAAGARRLIAQSIAFAYAVGPEPHAETDAHASGDDDDARGVRARD